MFYLKHYGMNINLDLVDIWHEIRLGSPLAHWDLTKWQTHFADCIYNGIFLKETSSILINILNFVSKGRNVCVTACATLSHYLNQGWHYGDVKMSAMASQITSLTIVYSTVYSGADQRKHQSSASLAFVQGIHWGPVNSPHKGPVTRKMFPFDDVIMILFNQWNLTENTNILRKCFLKSFGHCVNKTRTVKQVHITTAKKFMPSQWRHLNIMASWITGN